MKFLLVGINAKYIHSNPAIYSLSSYAGGFVYNNKALADSIELAEYTINQNVEEILEDIYLRKPDIVGFSCYIWNIQRINQLVEELHQIMPKLHIWLGGPEVSYRAKSYLESRPYITGIMVGEGEKTFRNLLELYLQTEEETSSINGIWDSLDKKQIGGIVTKLGETPAGECMDINEIPFFYSDLDNFQNRIIYYESSRGCPFRCSYCLSSIEKKMRFRKTETVKMELQFFLEHKVPQVKFIDRTFNAVHEHAMEIWTYIHEHDNGITNFHFEISADLLKPDEIALLNQMRPGLVQLEIGVQSTNEDTIHAINRKMDLSILRKTVNAVKSGNNIHQHLDLIAGLPYEDYESFHKSFCDVYAMRPNQLQLGFLKVLHGTQMYEEAQKYEIAYRTVPPYEVLCTKWLPYEDVIKLKHIESMVELYYNSNQYRNTLQFLEHAFEDSFIMFEKLADYYVENGYMTMSAKRIYHYDILLQFAKKMDCENAMVYQELLTYDIYLRENMKTRPLFANDMDIYKDEIRSIYKEEEKAHTLLPAYMNYDSKQMYKMTHLEYFNYPVWSEEYTEVTQRLQKPKALIFDYQKRNPLTGDADVLFVES